MRMSGLGLLMLGLLTVTPDGAAQINRVNDQDLFTNVYVVPPTFLSIGAGAPDPFAADPFAKRVDIKDPTAKSVLRNAGITFGNGASAIYNPETSQLIVRNTQDQLELVEAYLDAIRLGVEKQMRVELRIATLSDVSASDEVFKTLRPGGTNCRPASPDFDYPEPFLAELNENAEPTQGVTREIIGTFSPEQTATIFESLAGREKSKLSKPITKMCRSGQWTVGEIEERRIGISTVLGADESTIDIHTFLPSTAKPFETDIIKGFPLPDGHSETIRDGNTVAIAERGPSEEYKVLFVSATIVDAQGKPLRKAGVRSHVVEKGETLAEIAAVHGLTAAQILEKNRLPDGKIVEGEILILPPAIGVDAVEPDPAIALALKKIVIPDVDFDDTAFGEALAFLKNESLRETEEKEIEVPRFTLRGVEHLADEKLTLRLRNVPLSEALRYTTSLMICRFVIEGDTVVIEPIQSK